VNIRDPEASLHHSFLILFSIFFFGSQAFKFSNLYAPEHLIVNIRDPEASLHRVQDAGEGLPQSALEGSRGLRWSQEAPE